jgi:phospholipid/cholesterol/gamma-HCH transport system permease protein
MRDPGPHFESMVSSGATTFRLSGEWVAQYCQEVEGLAQQAPTDRSPLTLDVTAIERLDTFGAWSIETIRRSASSGGVPATLVGLSDENAAILKQVHGTIVSDTSSGKKRATVADALEAIGRGLVVAGEAVLSLLAMLGRLILSLLAGLWHPKSLKWKSLIHHIDQAGLQAVPIISLMTFLIGCIIAQQGIFYFRKFGATDYVVDLVTILVLREIGVLLVTIMVAGRSGSSYTAEIGSMKMREEIDALRTMGLDPVDVLILPRVLALVISVPALTFISMIAALCGAGVVACTYGEISPAIYVTRLREAFSHIDFQVGMIKAPVMALVIGTVAAVEGSKVEGSAASLGQRTTASVVKSIFFVIVLDGIFAVLFASLGM